MNRKFLGLKERKYGFVWFCFCVFVFFCLVLFVYIKYHMELIAPTANNFLEKDVALIFLKTWCTFNYSRDQEVLKKPFSLDDIFSKKSWNEVSSMEEILSVTACYTEVLISFSQMYFTFEVRWKTRNRDGTCILYGFMKGLFSSHWYLIFHICWWYSISFLEYSSTYIR